MKSIRPGRTGATLSWGVLDQIVSSGSTFIFIVVAAKALNASEVGAISFAFELYLLGVFAARGVAGDPLTSRYSGLTNDELRPYIRSSAAAAMLMGVGLGILLALGSFFADPPLRYVLLVGAVALPGLTLQDFVRSALIVQGRVRATFVNDCLWTFGQVPVLIVATKINPSAPTVFGAWAATGALAALIGLLQLGTGIGVPSAVRPWLRETRDLWPYYLGDNLVYELTSLTFLVVVSATAGLAAMAGFRVAMTMYSPLSLVGRGVITVSVAMLARRRSDPESVRRNALLISAVLTPFAIGWGLVMLVLPMSVGEAFFGESWHEAHPLVFLASFVCAGSLFSTGAIVGMRALGAGRHTLTGRLIFAVGAGACATIGGILGQATGVFEALAWFFPVQALMWWLLLRDATQRAKRRLARASAQASGDL